MRILILLVLSLSLFLSCSSDNSDDNSETLTTSGLVVDVPDGVPFPSTSSASIDTRDENAWFFVRQSATWGDANSQFVDQLLVSLLNSGLLTRTATYTATDQVINNQEFTLRLTVGQDTVVSTASAFSGSKTYSNKMELWRESDNAKAMEMFFDSAIALGDDGVLLYYDLTVLDPESFTGDSVIVESYTFDSTDGKKQTYTWSGGDFIAGGNGRAGRVIIENMDNNTLFCFKSVVKFNGTDLCTNNADEYYALAYTQNLGGNGEVTAKLSYGDNEIGGSQQLCATTHTLDYGLFNSAGFVSDGNSSGGGASYPTTSRVDTLFGEINTAGAGAWDDTRQATIDGLNIQFVDTSAP